MLTLGDLLVRNVPEEVVAKLKRRAQHHNRSLQQELLRILTNSARSSLEDYITEVREHRARFGGRNFDALDSVDMIREDRDSGR